MGYNNKECQICGSDKNLSSVIGKYGNYKTICDNCIDEKISKISEYDILKAEIKGILDSLSDCQRYKAIYIAKDEIEKMAFSSFE